MATLETKKDALVQDTPVALRGEAPVAPRTAAQAEKQASSVDLRHQPQRFVNRELS